MEKGTFFFFSSILYFYSEKSNCDFKKKKIQHFEKVIALFKKGYKI